MDATRKDGMQVMLKRVDVRGGQQELKIAQRFSSPEVRGEPHNHCVPLLEILKLPDTLDQKLIVMPTLRPFHSPHFQTFGEFVAFFTQICEVSSTCHLIRGIGRPDPS